MARKHKSRAKHFSRVVWLRRALLFVIPLIGCLLALLVLSFLKPIEVIPSVTLPPEVSKPGIVGAGLPVSLSIPSIAVTASIDYVGLTAAGAMDIKEDPTKVAWYEPGPRPGDSGSAVIAGHYGFLRGVGSIFNNLSKLQPGDTVNVTDDAGVMITFKVRSSRRYEPNADTSAIFGSNDGRSHLNLITCEGTWVQSEHSYSDRLVVFTDRKV